MMNWKVAHRCLLAVFCVVLFAPAALAGIAEVTATQEETDAAWKAYWSTAMTTEPVMKFPYQECFESAARMHDVPLTLALAVSRGESGFQPDAISKSDAIGMMQILWPITAKHLGFSKREDLFKPCLNIEAGVRYLREMLDRYNNNVHLTMAAYNYGPGRIGTTDTRIPEGAAWYSGYIFNHLEYVLGSSAPNAGRPAPDNYEDEKTLTLITFNEPERAAAFVHYLRNKVPMARLDWFDNRLGRWTVNLLYQDESEREASSAALKEIGFFVPEK